MAVKWRELAAGTLPSSVDPSDDAIRSYSVLARKDQAELAANALRRLAKKHGDRLDAWYRQLHGPKLWEYFAWGRPLAG